MNQKLGIDASKVKLDAALLKVDGKYRCKVFSKDTAGFKSLLLRIETNVATGAYHEDLALCPTDQGPALGVRILQAFVLRLVKTLSRRSRRVVVANATGVKPGAHQRCAQTSQPPSSACTQAEPVA
jgi:transposase